MITKTAFHQDGASFKDQSPIIVAALFYSKKIK